MHSSLAIANYFIAAAVKSGLATRDFPPSKVHGLVYLAYGWLLGSAGAAIMKGQVMADRDGVFIDELRAAGCAGTKNVTELVSVVEMDEKRGMMVEQTPQLTPNNPTIAALQWAWKTYGALSSFAISQHVKEAGSPWDKTWNADTRKGEEARPIPASAIKAWFKSLSGKRQQQAENSKLTKTQKIEGKVDKSQFKLRSS